MRHFFFWGVKFLYIFISFIYVDSLLTIAIHKNMCRIHTHIKEYMLFVECVGGNEGVVDDNFSGDFEDNSDESMNDVQLDDSEEESTIGLVDGFDLPISKIGRMKNE